MKIEVLGTGCQKCTKLYEQVHAAVMQAGIGAEITKVTKLSDISNYGVMITPALVIDGTVKVAGRVPSVDDIVKWLK